MSLIWFIIKLILFILLGILLLALMIIGLVLLVPIRYEGYFAKYDEMAYEIKVRYLPGIKVSFYLDEGVKKHQVSIFGKRLYEVNEVHDLEDEEVEKNKESKEIIKFNQKIDKEQVNATDKKESFQNVSMQKKKTDEERKIKNQEEASREIESRDTYKQISSEIKEGGERLSKAVEAERDTIDVKELLLDPLTYRTLKRLLSGIWQLIKIIGPKEWDFEMVVGTGESADTGELIAKLTMLYPLYYRHGIIRGDYEKECLMGGFLVKGKFNLLQVIILLIRLYFDKNIHAFVHLIKK